MSEKSFTDITDDVDALLNHPEHAPAIAEHRAEMADADRRSAMGLAAVRHAFDLTQTEPTPEPGSRTRARCSRRADALS
jgi:hypothetical protein